METIWKVFSCFVALLFLELCNGLPLDLDHSYADGHTQFLTGLIAVLLTICGVVCLAGCLCCQRRNGFKDEKKEFRDSPVVISVASNLDHGHVNPIANGEFTIFTPLSPPHLNNNVFLANQQVITRAEEDFRNGDIDVSPWFEKHEKDFPRTRLKYIKEFGKGWFGRVVEGTAQGLDDDAAAWTPVIVRILEATASSRQRVLFLHDAATYRCPPHPNLLKLLGRSLESIPLLLLQEHSTQGDLKLYLQNQQSTKETFLSSDLPLRWCYQLASAVKHLHDYNITHPDLAARNCQISQDLDLKLGDYGCSTSDYPEDYYHGTENVPVRWCAPECVSCTATTIQTKNVTMASNIWSLGVCLWEIYECGIQPFSHLTDDEVVSQVLGPPNLRLSKPSISVLYTDYVYKLMQLCWLTHESRPSISQIDLMLVDLVQVHKNTSEPHVSIQDFDSRWETLKPNVIVKRDNHTIEVIEPENDLTNITVLNMSMKNEQDGKMLSASLHNLAGSFDNLLETSGSSWLDNIESDDLSFARGLSDAIHDLDTAIAAENLSSSDSSPRPAQTSKLLQFKLGPTSTDRLLQRTSSESETEDETWRKKIEQGAYTEKVRQKSRSVADLMVLTHIDCSESDSETPLPSLDYRFNYRNVRYGPKQNLENVSLTFGSEGNLLSVQDTFQQELKKLQEERRDSLLFVPEHNTNALPNSKRVLEDLNSPANLEPQNQVFNVYNVVAISPKYSPIHATDLDHIIHYKEDKMQALPDLVLNTMESKRNIPKLSEIIENNIELMDYIVMKYDSSPPECDDYSNNYIKDRNEINNVKNESCLKETNYSRLSLNNKEEEECLKQESKEIPDNDCSKTVACSEPMILIVNNGGLQFIGSNISDHLENLVNENRDCTEESSQSHTNSKVCVTQESKVLAEEVQASKQIPVSECCKTIESSESVRLAETNERLQVNASDVNDNLENYKHNENGVDSSQSDFKDQFILDNQKNQAEQECLNQDSSDIPVSELLQSNDSNISNNLDKCEIISRQCETRGSKAGGGDICSNTDESSQSDSKYILEYQVEEECLNQKSEDYCKSSDISDNLEIPITIYKQNENGYNKSEEVDICSKTEEASQLDIKEVQAEEESKDILVSDCNSLAKTERQITDICVNCEVKSKEDISSSTEESSQSVKDSKDIIEIYDVEKCSNQEITDCKTEILQINSDISVNLDGNSNKEDISSNTEVRPQTAEDSKDIKEIQAVEKCSNQESKEILISDCKTETLQINDFDISVNLDCKSKEENISSNIEESAHSVKDSKDIIEIQAEEVCSNQKSKDNSVSVSGENVSMTDNNEQLINDLDINDSLENCKEYENDICNKTAESHNKIDNIQQSQSESTNLNTIMQIDLNNKESDLYQSKEEGNIERNLSEDSAIADVNRDELSENAELDNKNLTIAFCNERSLMVKTQDFINNEILKYEDSNTIGGVKFDISETQDECAPNSLTHYGLTSTPYKKRSIQENAVILGASDDYSIDYYSGGLKTTTDGIPSSSPVKGNMKYSLETWDNFLGRSFDEQRDFDGFSSEPQSMLFLDTKAEEPKVEADEINKTFVVDQLNETYNIVDTDDDMVDLSDINVEMEDSGESKDGQDNPGYWESETGGGWFLHPQTTGEDVSGQMDVSEDDSYVGFSMDDEIMAAIRNELLTKLPQAQRASAEHIEDGDGEYETTDRNEVFVRYNCYNTPLSPIPEESYSELLHSGQSTPHCTINTDLGDESSDWSEPGIDPNSILDDDTHSPRVMESPHKGPLHRHTPSQDSCCSNDTLFNLEELQYTEKLAESVEAKTVTEPAIAELDETYAVIIVPESPSTVTNKQSELSVTTVTHNHTNTDAQVNENENIDSSLPSSTDNTTIKCTNVDNVCVTLDESVDIQPTGNDIIEPDTKIVVPVLEVTVEVDASPVEKLTPENQCVVQEEDAVPPTENQCVVQEDDAVPPTENQCVLRIQPTISLDISPTYTSEFLDSVKPPVKKEAEESSSGSETYLTVSDGYVLPNVAPLNSPEDRPWKHIEASLSRCPPELPDEYSIPQPKCANSEDGTLSSNSEEDYPTNEYENIEEMNLKNALVSIKNVDKDLNDIYECIESETIKLNPEYVNDIPTYVNQAIDAPAYVNCDQKSSPVKLEYKESPIMYENVNYEVYIDLLNDDPEVEYSRGSVEDVYGPLTDIRFSGPGDSQMMTTSFSDSNDLGDEQDWDSGSDTRSSSSGEFIWKEGEHEASVKALHAAPQDAEVQPDDDQRDEEESSSGSEEECDGPEFVPSAWDKFAAPTKSALRSPEKTMDRPEKKPRGVSFKKQKYHCVYEYPREPDSPVVQSYDMWQDPSNAIDWDVDRDSEPFLPATSETEIVIDTTSMTQQNLSNRPHRNLYQTSNVPDFIGSSILDDDFYISSSAKPFDMFSAPSSQFFPGRHCDWSELIKNNDNITPDSGVEDITPGSLSDSSEYVRPSRQILPLKTLAQLAINKGSQAGSNEIGGLRHTRNRLKLDLPPSPSAFTKTFSIEPIIDPVVNRQVPTFTTFGKSRFVVQQVDTPTDDLNVKNVSFEALPYKPMTTHVYKEDPSLEKHRVEIVRGEASLLDSADEDSGIESCTLERKRVSEVSQ